MKKKMTFDRYLLEGFSNLDAGDRSKSEKIAIIKDVLTSLGDGEATFDAEKKQFKELRKQGHDMDQLTSTLKDFVQNLSDTMGLKSFDDLLLIKEYVLANKNAENE